MVEKDSKIRSLEVYVFGLVAGVVFPKHNLSPWFVEVGLAIFVIDLLAGLMCLSQVIHRQGPHTSRGGTKWSLFYTYSMGNVTGYI